MNTDSTSPRLASKLVQRLHRTLNNRHHCIELAPGYGINERALNEVVAAWTIWGDTPAALVFPERLGSLAGGSDNLALLIADLDASAVLRSSGGPSPYLHLIPFTVWIDQSRSYVLRRDCLMLDLDALDALVGTSVPSFDRATARTR